jgi:hypothetical protein
MVHDDAEARSMTPRSCKAIPMPMVIPPMNWERAVTGVDDAPDGEHTEHPRDVDLAGVSVDSNLGELGAKGMPRPSIIIDLGRLSLGLCPRPRVSAVLIAERLGGRDDGCTPADRAERTSGVSGVRQVWVTDFHSHALRRATQRLGRDLRQDGPTSGCDLSRRYLDCVGAIGLEANAGDVVGFPGDKDPTAGLPSTTLVPLATGVGRPAVGVAGGNDLLHEFPDSGPIRIDDIRISISASWQLCQAEHCPLRPVPVV